MSDGLLLIGILALLGGILVFCAVGAVLLGVLAVRLVHDDDSSISRENLSDGEMSKADSVLFTQWNNLLGYNGSEGDDLDE